MNRRIPTIAVAIVIAALQGCAMQQPPVRDPDYAPTMPPTPVSPKDNNGSIYQASSSVGLFEDVKAHRVGDILTIKLVERPHSFPAHRTSALIGISIGLLLGDKLDVLTVSMYHPDVIMSLFVTYECIKQVLNISSSK